MPALYRVVLDANVLVSALISGKGAPAELLRLWQESRFELVVSPAIVEELERVLRYPRIRERYRLTESAVDRFVTLLSQHAIVVAPSQCLQVVWQDPADDRYLEAALAGQGRYLVTGDRHLLSLERYEGVEILTPAGFVALLRLAGE